MGCWLHCRLAYSHVLSRTGWCLPQTECHVPSQTIYFDALKKGSKGKQEELLGSLLFREFAEFRHTMFDVIGLHVSSGV